MSLHIVHSPISKFRLYCKGYFYVPFGQNQLLVYLVVVCRFDLIEITQSDIGWFPVKETDFPIVALLAKCDGFICSVLMSVQ